MQAHLQGEFQSDVAESASLLIGAAQQVETKADLKFSCSVAASRSFHSVKQLEAKFKLKPAINTPIKNLLQLPKRREWENANFGQ